MPPKIPSNTVSLAKVNYNHTFWMGY